MNALPPLPEEPSNASAQPSRRNFVRQSLAVVAGTSSALGALGLSGCGGSPAPAPPPEPPPAPPPPPAPSSISFSHGVASGDPLQDRLILWTRVLDSQDRSATLTLRWEVATDAEFTSVLSQGEAVASPDKDHTVKVDAGGLRPGQRYFYRFICKGQSSPVGRSQTLPSQTERVKLAVFSCANYPSGFFNAYAEAAKREDLDAVVHLGDYLYEYGRGDYADSQAKALGREVEPANEALSLDDYRRRYAQYRRDPDLLALHAALPMIAVWDDHEVCDDAWSGGGANHQPSSEGLFSARKAAALQAYHEWLPIRSGAQPEQIYRSFAFGELLALHMLDTRLVGREQQLSYSHYRQGENFDQAGFQAQLKRTDRQLLGETQQRWLQQQLARSSATWQVLGQQVLMARMNIPAALRFEFDAPGSGLSPKAYAELVLKAQLSPGSLTAAERAWLALPHVPLNLDAWDGYDAAREALLASAHALNKNLVVLAGDSHNAWASNLADASGQAVGVEFATASVSSPGIESYLSPDAAELLGGLLSQLNSGISYANTSQRGLMLITATPQECQAEWVFVSTTASRNYSAEVGGRLKVLPGAGQRRLKPV